MNRMPTVRAAEAKHLERKMCVNTPEILSAKGSYAARNAGRWDIAGIKLVYIAPLIVPDTWKKASKAALTYFA